MTLKVETARLYGLVPCAGVGSRAATSVPKQYATIAGRSLVAHTLRALAGVARLTTTLVVLSPDDETFGLAAPEFQGWIAKVGGDTRAQSVANGLAALRLHGASEGDWVLVHDAARCLVRAGWIDALIDACQGDEVGGLLAWPASDTLKRQVSQASSTSDGFARVEATVDRHGMWQAQTPQMFRLGLLQRALDHAGANVTDEASAVEAMGHSPRLVPGAFENFKLTYPQDFELAERLLATRDTDDERDFASKPT